MVKFIMFSKSKTFYFTNLKKKSYRKKGRSTKRSGEVEKKQEAGRKLYLLVYYYNGHNSIINVFDSC